MNSTASHPLHGPIFISLVLVFIFGCLVALGLLFALLWVIVSRSPSTTGRSSLGRSAAVVVLGDVGRSPRMCYHAQSLAEDGWRVAVVGYQGTPPPPPLRRSSVKHHHLSRPVDSILQKLPRTGSLFTFIAAPLKVIAQSVSLFWVLAGEVKPPPELIIVQSPPALPTLFIVRLVGLLLGSKVIIDWHNLSYTILALRFRSTGIIVRLARALERWTGRSAFAHLCVTNALKQHLQENWKVKGPVKVLYDRPPSHFRKATSIEANRLLSNLAPRLEPSLQDWFPGYQSPSSSPFTNADGQFRQDRPALVVSSTSWTVDEDFRMLLKAASLYEARARALHLRNEEAMRPSSPALLDSPTTFSYDDDDKSFKNFKLSGGSGRDKSRRASVTSLLPEAKQLPKMLLIVTGKGELKEQYVKEIAKLEREEGWQWIKIRTAWLLSEEYPVLLGSANIGVSLHSSSSGMDLPMKVVDMLGCDLSVCALGFPCIGELVQHGKNGLVFYNAQELASQLESLLSKHPHASWLSEKMSSMDSLFPRVSTSRASLESPLIRQGFQKQGNDHQSESSRASSPPPSPYLNRPPSPMPTFTLLASPVMMPSDGDTITDSRPQIQNRQWSGNWKRVVRPLVEEADEAEEAKSRMNKWEHGSSSWPFSLWNYRSKGWKKSILKKRDSVKSILSTPRTSHDSSTDETDAGASGVPSRFDDGSILPRRSPRQLRQRAVNRSQAWTGTSQERMAGLFAPSNTDSIPDIEISPAEAT